MTFRRNDHNKQHVVVALKYIVSFYVDCCSVYCCSVNMQKTPVKIYGSHVKRGYVSPLRPCNTGQRSPKRLSFPRDGTINGFKSGKHSPKANPESVKSIDNFTS